MHIEADDDEGEEGEGAEKKEEQQQEEQQREDEDQDQEDGDDGTETSSESEGGGLTPLFGGSFRFRRVRNPAARQSIRRVVAQAATYRPRLSREEAALLLEDICSHEEPSQGEGPARGWTGPRARIRALRRGLGAPHTIFNRFLGCYSIKVRPWQQCVRASVRRVADERARRCGVAHSTLSWWRTPSRRPRGCTSSTTSRAPLPIGRRCLFER